MDLAPVRADSTQPDAADLHITEPLCAVFRKQLRAEGLKYTPERARILDAIIQMDDVFQADQLLAKLRQSPFRVSKATIYRTIKLLADAGIIQQVLFDAEQSHYQLAYGKRSSGLLVRVDTRQITPIEIPELVRLRDRICAERGLTPEGHRLVIYATGK
jgi:Fur family ferric uptake transcriptional regulator